MAELMRCPQGHTWERPSLPAGQRLHCPTCSMPLTMVTEQEAAVIAAATPAPPPACSQPEAGTFLTPLAVTISGYEILRELGRGGQAVVYQAIQKSTRRDVAIKVLMEGPCASKAARRRFEREIELASSLKHPNIITVFDSGMTHDGRECYMMDYVNGPPITDYASRQQLSIRQKLELLVKVADALHYAHQRGVIHRDLKPANILVDETGQPKILDFGLARASESDLQTTVVTEIGQFLGTLPYMSPEQLQGDPHNLDIRSDIYALGVILYQLLVGQLPLALERRMFHEAQRIVREEDPTRLSSINRSLRGDVETIVAKALEKEKDRRYQSAAELSGDIRRYLSDEPIIARPPSLRYQFIKFARRNRVLVGGIAAVLVALVLGIVATSWQAAIARRERDRANVNARKAGESAAEAQKNELAAEERLAESLVLAGDSFLYRGRPADARERYTAAWNLARKRRMPEMAAISGLLASYIEGPPPLMRCDGARSGFGGPVSHTRPTPSGDVSSVLSVHPTRGEEPASSGARPSAPHPPFRDIRPAFPVAFSRDGRAVLCAANCEKVLRHWDVFTGNEIRSFVGYTEPACSVALSPDGHTALSGGYDETLRLWDIATGREIRSFTGHTGPVNSVKFSPDGRTAFSGSYDQTLRLWDVSTGKELRCFTGHTAPVRSVAFSPDGCAALSGGYDNALRLWDVSTGNEIRNFTGHEGVVWSVAFSPDGRTALSGGYDQTLRHWDLATGKEIRRFTSQSGQVLAVAFSPDARTALSGDEDNKLRLWDVATGAEIRSYIGHVGQVVSVAFSPDGRTVVSGSFDNTLRLWDVSTGKEIRSFTGYTSRVLSVAFSPDGRTALSGSENNAVRLWDLSPGREIRSFIGHAGWVIPVAFSPDGRTALSGSTDSTLRLWDVATARQIRSFKGHTDVVTSVAFSPDGRAAFSASSDSTVRLWDLATGKQIQSFTGHTTGVYSVAFSPDGRTAISASGDHTLRLWDVSTGREVGIFTMPSGWPESVAFSPDGHTALSGNVDGTLTFWDVAAGKEIRTIVAHSREAWAVAFSRDGRTALSGSRDSTLRLWDPATGKEIRSFTGHMGPVNSVTFSPDGRTAFSGSYDQTLRLWDVSTGKELRCFTGHTAPVRSVAFSPDGCAALSGSDDGTLRLWDFSRPAQYARFESRLPDSQRSLDKNPDDASAMIAFGEWYAFRGQSEWAAELLERARRAGAAVDPLTLARQYWMLGRFQEAKQEFERASALKLAPAFYLRLCMDAVGRQAATPTTLPAQPAMNIPQRSSKARPEMIDLGPFFNGSLIDGWFPSAGWGSAAKINLPMPLGIHRLGGVEFDVRGV